MSRQHYIEQLFATMGQIMKLVESQSAAIHDDKRATIMQFSALKFIKLHPNSTVSELAAQLQVSKSSATQLIERLESARLLQRHFDTQDRRIVRLLITAAGEEKFQELKKIFFAKLTGVFAHIPETDLQELVRIQTDLVESLRQSK
jgi:DNA-binding MarR family transcriptional regulator